MVKIIWTTLAIDDLKGIHDYISKESNVYANKMIEKLIARVDQFQHFQDSGKIVPEFGQKSIRELIYGNYRIVYKNILTILELSVYIMLPGYWRNCKHYNGSVGVTEL